jgi:hypothetical protein
MRAGLVAGDVLACAVFAAAGHAGTPSLGPVAPDAQQTMPTVSPRHGHGHTVFTVSFTARTATVAHASGTQARYIVMAVRRGTSTPTSCNAQVSRNASAAMAGARVRVRLRAARRWCVGHYRATVVLQRDVACTQPPTGPPVACPAIAFAPLDAGHVTFVVRPG